MKFVVQIGVLLLALSLLLLVFKLLVKSRFLPLLIWCGLGWKLYPQWSAAHPFIFYGGAGGAGPGHGVLLAGPLAGAQAGGKAV